MALYHAEAAIEKPFFDVSQYSTLVPGTTLLEMVPQIEHITSVHIYPRRETIAGSSNSLKLIGDHHLASNEDSGDRGVVICVFE